MIRLVSGQLKVISSSFVKITLRSKGAIGVFLAGAILIILSNGLGDLYFGERSRVLLSSGFFLLGMWGVLVSVYFGASVINKEIQDKTIYLLLVRPMSRQTYLLGKWFGMISALCLLFTGLTSVFLLNLSLNGVHLSITLLGTLFFVYIEWCILASFSVFFSTFTTPFLNGVFVFFVWMFGHLSNDILVYYNNVSEESYAVLLKIAHMILPNLEAINFRNEVIYGKNIVPEIFVLALGVSFLWIMVILICANLIFSFRKLS